MSGEGRGAMGDQAKWRSLRGRLVRYARTIGVSPEDADDVAQQLLERMLRGGVLDLNTSPEGYLRRACLNAIRSEYRARNRRRVREKSAIFAEMPPTPERDLVTARCRVLWSDAFEAMARELPSPVLLSFLMCDVEQMPASAVAMLLACPEGTVRTRIRRARAYLHRVLRHRFDGYDYETLKHGLLLEQTDRNFEIDCHDGGVLRHELQAIGPGAREF